jgi:hypothetical protein
MCTPVYVDFAVVCSVLIEIEGLAINHLCRRYLIEYRMLNERRYVNTEAGIQICS